MKFLLFRRADSALVVVPSLFQPPLASRSGGALQPVGECDLDLDALNPRIAFELGQHGFALLQGEEWAALEVAMQLSDASAAARLSPGAQRLPGDRVE